MMGVHALRKAIMELQPRAYFPMQESFGVTAYTLGSDTRDLGWVGGPRMGQPGPFPGIRSVELDGASQYGVTAATDTPPTDFTVGYWVKRFAGGLQSTFTLATSGNPASIYGDTFTDIWRLGTSQGSGDNHMISQGPSIVNGQWYFICSTFLASTPEIKMYVNGVLVNTSTSQTGSRYMSACNLWVARYNSSFTQYFGGWMTQVFMSPLVATPAQVARIYRAASAPDVPSAQRRRRLRVA